LYTCQKTEYSLIYGTVMSQPWQDGSHSFPELWLGIDAINRVAS
jgi:hypothetical protein